MKKLAKQLSACAIAVLLACAPPTASLLAAENADLGAADGPASTVLAQQQAAVFKGAAAIRAGGHGADTYAQAAETVQQAFGPVAAPENTGDPAMFDPEAGISDFFADFAFPAVQSLQGVFSSVGMYVTMPEYSVAENATLRISYTCSNLIIEELSTLTFSMNGTPFYSCPVAYDSAGATVLYIEVPLSLFVDQYNFLEISAYVRLTWEDGCIDDYMGANWINLEEETVLRIGYQLAEDESQLRHYPYPFVSLLDQTGKSLAVCVSDVADNGELTAALLAMACLGEAVNDQSDISFGRVSGLHGSKNLILFALTSNLPSEYHELLNDETVPEGSALLKRTRQDGRDVLLVVSGTGEGLLEAARLLGDSSRIAYITSGSHIVAVGEAEALMQNLAMNEAVSQGQYTLKEIAGNGIRLTGPFRQEATVYLPVPSDYVLSEECKFVVKFRYSENLDFSRSLVTVYWDDIPITSKKLTADNAGNDTLAFVPPADLVGTGGTSIRIVFDLEIEDMVCTPRQMDMPWAYVSEDSTFFFPLGNLANLDLAHLPAPFQQDGELNQVLAVVGKIPTDAELQLLGQTFSVLGSGCGAYGSIKTIRAREFSLEDADYNIVACGIPKTNAFLRTVNDSLYIQYNDSFDSFTANEKVAMDTQYAKTASTMQLMYSPYSSERVLLVLSAVEDDSLAHITGLLAAASNRWGLKGDVAVIDQQDRVTAYQFLAQQAEPTQPGFFESVSQNPQSVLFTAIAVGVMLILLVAVLLILLRIRAHRGHSDE